MFRPLASSALALMVAAAPVFADVSPSQVWDHLASYYDRVGYQVSVGAQDDSGDQLVLTDVVIGTGDEAEPALSITMPRITLTQTGDARVRTVFDEDIEVLVADAMPERDDPDLVVMLSMPGNEMTSSGSPEELLHEFDYPDLRVSFELPETPQEDAQVSLTLGQLQGSQTTSLNAQLDTSYDMTAASMVFALAFTEPDSPEEGPGTGRLTMEVDVADLALSGQFSTPEGEVDLSADLAGALKAGMVSDSKLTMGAMTGRFDFIDVDDDGEDKFVNAQFTAESSGLEMDMSREGISYRSESGPSQIEASGSDLPIPISFGIGSVSGALVMPFEKSDQPQPFSLSYEIADLTLGDDIWSLFDEDGHLPRDPAGLAIDLEGQLLLQQDLFDPEFGMPADSDDPQEMTAADMPILPQSVTFNRLALNAAGASAEVTGQLDLADNPQEPVGQINGIFSGIGGLMDNLIAMGVVPQEQAMGLRMMLAMFTQTVDGNPDQLETQLEFREGGAIFANGQQVK